MGRPRKRASPLEEIIDFTHEVAEAAPAVIFHPGWLTARYKDSFYASRTAYILNVLFGSLETPGGLFFQKGPGDAGAKGLNVLMNTIPKPEEKRVDGCGWKYKHFEAGPGLMHLFYKALLEKEPYPVKAYLVFRHDPLLSLPDPEAQKKALDKLDLLVAIDANYSETAWYADVLLPSATYLEKSSVLCTGKGLKPSFRMRRKSHRSPHQRQAGLVDFQDPGRAAGCGRIFQIRRCRRFLGMAARGHGVSPWRTSKKKGFHQPGRQTHLVGPVERPEVQDPIGEDRTGLQPCSKRTAWNSLLQTL
jgi:thiosulfate reductase/polysulfide reductase chain A